MKERLQKNHRQVKTRWAAIPLALTVFSMLTFNFNVRAQDRLTISGTVLSESNEALPGVNVLMKGTTNGTTTDSNGKYILSVPDGSGTLIFTFIGYATVESPINNQTTIDVSMSPDVTSLSEVVVVGYGTQKRADITGSLAS